MAETSSTAAKPAASTGKDSETAGKFVTGKGYRLITRATVVTKPKRDEAEVSTPAGREFYELSQKEAERLVGLGAAVPHTRENARKYLADSDGDEGEE